MTLSILWEEYIAAEPGGYRYSRFCELYRAWEGRLSVTMRQSHAASDKLFVDYAGDGVPVVVDRGVASWIAFYLLQRSSPSSGAGLSHADGGLARTDAGHEGCGHGGQR
ncbi:transposase [Bradyrhizobium sp. S3.14.4]